MIIGTVCARKGSKGVPNKNMRDMLGWPLVYYTMWCAQKYPFDDIILSTDDPDVKRYCAPGIFAELQPDEFAKEGQDKWGLFGYIAKRHNLQPTDILVDLDIGCPLREVEDIAACVELLEEANCDVVCTAYESERNPYFNMVEKNRWGDWQIPCKMLAPITRRQDAPKVYSLSPAVFAIRVEALTNYTHWSQAKLGIDGIPRERGIDIDTQDDWDYVEYLMSRKDVK